MGHTVSLLNEYAPAYPILMVLLIGYGAANIFFWNRPLLLAQGNAGFPFKVSFWAMVGKVSLTFALLPWAGYLAEAYLLSGYFLLSVGLIVWRGLGGIGRVEGSAQLESEPV